MLIHALFPYWYAALLVGFFIGIGITVALFGFVSAGAICFAAWIGVISVTPLINFINNLVYKLFPGTIEKIKVNIKESFKLRHSLPNGRYIYMWHPHGLYNASQYLHIASNLTKWPSQDKNIKITGFHGLLWLPFISEIFEHIGIVPTSYNEMKKTLVEETSLSVCPGGMREMLPVEGDETAMRVFLKKRRGIFKLALETGTPLIPVISFGEHKLYEPIYTPKWIQDFLEPYDMCIPIPTVSSVLKWFSLISNPLTQPVITVVGEPVLVEKVENPSNSDIVRLRERYIDSLVAMYKKEKELCEYDDIGDLKIE
jgi:1-acyl-sn-glycerol-3-phosphate acyltransferase